jgi:hypothetical protein
VQAAAAPLAWSASSVRVSRKASKRGGGLTGEWLCSGLARVQITDADELAEYRLQKRKGFEDTIRRMRWSAGAWTKYAKWEENQGDIARASSVYERALDEDYHSVTMWCALRPPQLLCAQ